MNDLDALISQHDLSVSLDAEMGTNLLVQIHGVDGHMKSQLVGGSPDQYVIVASPKRTGIAPKLFEGNQVLVRYIHDGAVCSFQSNIIDVVQSPFPLIFLSYPVIMERRTLREEQRNSCAVPVEAGYAGQTWPAEIKDFSRSGCCLVSNLAGRLGLNKIQPGNKIDIRIETEGETPDRTFSAKVCNLRREDQRLFLGLHYTVEEAAEIIGQTQAELIALPTSKGKPKRKANRRTGLSGRLGL